MRVTSACAGTFGCAKRPLASVIDGVAPGRPAESVHEISTRADAAGDPSANDTTPATPALSGISDDGGFFAC